MRARPCSSQLPRQEIGPTSDSCFPQTLHVLGRVLGIAAAKRNAEPGLNLVGVGAPRYPNLAQPLALP